ncbi:MAG: formate dehydrogenase [Burkholderiaceae bacterium]
MSFSTNRLSRRTAFAGVGAVGAVAAVASLLPGRTPEAETPAPIARPMPTRGGGYTLSEHVKQYYKTARG